MAGIDDRTAGVAVAILRVTLGLLLLAHFLFKLIVLTPFGAAAFFSAIGLPSWLAYVSLPFELTGSIFLILGIYARWTAVAILPLIVGAILAVHGHNGFFFNNPGGGWEFLGFWAITLIVLSLLGDGSGALVPTRLPRRVRRIMIARGYNR